MQFAGEKGYLHELAEMLEAPDTYAERTKKDPVPLYSSPYSSNWAAQVKFQGVPKFQGNGKSVRFRSLNVLA